MATELSDLRALFVDEAREYVQLLNDGLLRLEAQPQEREVLHELFRAAHSLKGMAASVGLQRMVELAHGMESVLDALRAEQAATPGVETFDVLFECTAVLEQLLEAVARNEEPDAELGRKVERLCATLARHGEGLQPPGSAEPQAAARAGGTFPEASGHGGAVGPTGDGLADQGLWFIEAGQLARVRQALEQGQGVFVVEVTLAEDCVFKGARAYTVWRALESVGSVVGSWPGKEALLEERFDDRFVVAVVSAESGSAIEQRVLSVPEVRQVTVRAVPSAGEALPASARAAQASEGQMGPGQTAQPVAFADGAASAATPGTVPVAGGAAARGPSAGGARESTVRVETGRLDALVDLVGELVITTNQLQDAWQSRRLPDEAQMRKLSRVTSDLQSAVMRLRMVPLRHVFSRFPRTVRDLARRFGKQVEFVMEGEETELDRNIVNEIGDPLLHLLRNAIDHGIEPPEQRIARGKPPTGRIRLSAYHEGNHVVIELEDDGAGIDVERIRQKAVATGRLTAEQAQSASADELLQLIFEPGFSTASRVTDVSGRGVGMDAARTVVESLGGRLSVQTRPGRGTLCTIRLPLTLAVIRALLVECDQEVYAIPAETISSIERAPQQPERVRGRPVLRYRGRVIPLVSLRERLGLPSANGHGDAGLAVVLTTGRRTAAVAVDRVVGLQEIVIRSLSGYASVPGVAGATILGSGRVALILDAVWLL